MNMWGFMNKEVCVWHVLGFKPEVYSQYEVWSHAKFSGDNSRYQYFEIFDDALDYMIKSNVGQARSLYGIRKKHVPLINQKFNDYMEGREDLLAYIDFEEIE